jgi:hypothetical protein
MQWITTLVIQRIYVCAMLEEPPSGVKLSCGGRYVQGGFPTVTADVYISAMSDYRLYNLAVVPSRRSVQRGSMHAAHSVYVLRVPSEKAIYQSTESAQRRIV